MKKFLLACAVASCGFSFAVADSVTFDFKTNDYGLERGSSGYVTTGSISDGDITITLNTTSGNGFRLWSDGLRVYKGVADMNISCSEGVINSIIVSSEKGTVMGFDQNTLSSVKSAEWTTGGSDSVNLYFAPTANNAISNIVVNYSIGGPVLADANLSFGEETKFTVEMPGSFSAPTLTKDTNAEAVYTSSNPEVATVDASTGVVTLVGSGETVITATCEANDTYKKGSASYTLIVTTKGQNTYEGDFTDSGIKAAGELLVTLNEVTWSVNLDFAGGTSFGKDNNGRGLQIGSKNNPASSVSISTDEFSQYMIESVTFELANASGGNWSGTLQVGSHTLDIDGLTTSSLPYTLDNINEVGASIDLNMTQTTSTAFYIKGVKVVYNTDTSLKPAGLSFPESSYEVQWTNGSASFDAPEVANPNGLEVIYSSSDTSVATVDASTGVVTIVAPGVVKISATSTATDEYAIGKATYTLNIYAIAGSIKELLEMAEKNGEYDITFPLTVTYVNGLNVYVIDAAGDATLIYGSENDYKEGDVLATGWKAIYSPYNGLPEFKFKGDLPAVTEENVPFVIPEVTLSEAANESMLNKLFVIKDLKLTETIPADKINVTITDGSASLDFRNYFDLPAFTPEAEKTYSVKGILAIYNTTLQFYPIEYQVASGVANVEATAGEALYYDLNGRRVNGQLTDGIYVKVVDGKASKVVIK